MADNTTLNTEELLVKLKEEAEGDGYPLEPSVLLMDGGLRHSHTFEYVDGGIEETYSNCDQADFYTEEQFLELYKDSIWILFD